MGKFAMENKNNFSYYGFLMIYILFFFFSPPVHNFVTIIMCFVCYVVSCNIPNGGQLS